jgi:hypothetical protein
VAWVSVQAQWASIKKIVQTLRRHRSIAVQAGGHILHAGTPLDDDARATIVGTVKAAATALNELSQDASTADGDARSGRCLLALQL